MRPGRPEPPVFLVWSAKRPPEFHWNSGVRKVFPTYRNLFGTIETGGEPSATTFLEIKGGSLRNTEADLIVSNDPSCLMQLRGWLDNNRTSL